MLHTHTFFPHSPQIVPIKKKTEKREAARESKALSAARLEKSLERELIARLKSRAYGDAPLNVNEDVWAAVLNREKEVEAQKELEELGMESDDETDEESGEENEGEFEDEDALEFVSDFDESDVEDMEEYDGEVRYFLLFLVFSVLTTSFSRSSARKASLATRTTRRRRRVRKRRTTRRRHRQQGSGKRRRRLLRLRRSPGRVRFTLCFLLRTNVLTPFSFPAAQRVLASRWSMRRRRRRRR